MTEFLSLKSLMADSPNMGFWVFAAMFGIYWLREWRETRKLSSEDRLARRDGYAAQVSMLMGENRQLRSDLLSLEKRHDDYRRTCQEETAILQHKVIALETEIQQMKLIIVKDELQIASLLRGAA